MVELSVPSSFEEDVEVSVADTVELSVGETVKAPSTVGNESSVKETDGLSVTVESKSSTVSVEASVGEVVELSVTVTNEFSVEEAVVLSVELSVEETEELSEDGGDVKLSFDDELVAVDETKTVTDSRS
ncbi:hypothetical protein GQ53DRAFT_774891 [Thozetella sp. PMI_491]|nr:hypothetical protein GQ53DRAFT_774891 [Thozetella sp. PMI_491]